MNKLLKNEILQKLTANLFFVFVSILFTAFMYKWVFGDELENTKIIYTVAYKEAYSEGFNDATSRSFCLFLEEGASCDHSEPPYFTWDDCMTPEEASERGCNHTIGLLPMK